jgi:tRNA nucleotidyltransferase/poly(A) polymerase
MIELDRLLVGPGVESSLQLLADTRLISFLLPEVGLQSDMVSLDADSSRSLFDETVVAVGSAPNDVTARWAALLMHVGQAYLPEPGAGEDEFRGGSRRARALLAAEIVERTALYLKWSNRRREEVTRLVAEGQPDDA